MVVQFQTQNILFGNLHFCKTKNTKNSLKVSKLGAIFCSLKLFDICRGVAVANAIFRIFGQNRNFGQKSKFWSKNRNFGQKSKFWSKIGILVKTRNFGQTSKFWSKSGILVKNRKSKKRLSIIIFKKSEILHPRMSDLCITVLGYTL